MGLSNWPTVTDDDGSYTVGTVFNKSLTDSIKSSIEADLFSAANPSVTCENIIDEVVTARGSKASLDARLDVAINEDGTLKAVAGQATETQVAYVMGQGNWVQNDDFIMWPKGDSAAPSGYTLDTLAIARCGTGLGDTTTKVGPFCAKLTRSGSDGSLYQPVMTTASFSDSGDYFKSRDFGFGCWVKTSVASAARLKLSDGVTTTTTSYHTGGGGWEWLSDVHTLSSSSTKLEIHMEVLSNNGAAYFSGPTVIPSTLEPSGWIPCPKIYGAVVFRVAGPADLATGTVQDIFWPSRPIHVREVCARVGQAPTGQAIILDINVYDGAAWQSMFSTKPTIAAAANLSGITEPDGTYAYRTINGADDIDDSLLGLDIDQVGSGTAGSSLWVWVRAFQYQRPLDGSLLDVSDGKE